MLWHFSIRTGHEIEARRLDLLIIEKREKNCQIIKWRDNYLWWRGESKRGRESRKISSSRERNPKDVGGKEKGDTPWAEIRDSQRSICGLMPDFHFFQNIGTEMTKLLLKVKNQVLKYIYIFKGDVKAPKAFFRQKKSCAMPIRSSHACCHGLSRTSHHTRQKIESEAAIYPKQRFSHV